MASDFLPNADARDTFKHNLYWSQTMMMQVSNVLPGLPPLSMVTVIGMSIVAGSLLLYLLSRIPELLLITAISFIYAAVPMLSMIKHF